MIANGANVATMRPMRPSRRRIAPIAEMITNSVITALNGVDALLSIVQMPKGVPVGTLAIGAPGAANAALLAAQICALSDPALRERLRAWRKARADEVVRADEDQQDGRGQRK